ncbi:CoA transferase [Deinococcus radiodurans]|nr:CoA transferase [Deinococcus radiodurans]
MAVADVFAGALITQAILAALYQRERTGEGARVDVNLLEGVISLGTSQVSRYLTGGQIPGPQGNDHPSIVPYGTFECADGLINLAVGNDSLWEKFCAALGFGSLAANPLYATNEGRVRRREELNAELFPALMGFTRAQLSEKLEAAGVPCGPVNNMHEVFEDPMSRRAGSPSGCRTPRWRKPPSPRPLALRRSESPGAARPAHAGAAHGGGARRTGHRARRTLEHWTKRWRGFPASGLGELSPERGPKTEQDGVAKLRRRRWRGVARPMPSPTGCSRHAGAGPSR